MLKFLLYIVLILSLFACSTDNPITNNINPNAKQAIVLCEGLWGYDNSTIDLIDLDSGLVQKQFFESENGFNLGDTGTDIVLFEGFYYVSVTSSHSIEKIEAKSLKSDSRLKLDFKSEPRYITICSQNEAYYTDLKQNLLVKFNPTTMQKLAEVKVGAAPEGIAHNSDYIFVANSGLGDYKKNDPLAGYLSIISRKSFSIVKNEYIGFNPYQVQIDSISQKIYVSYRNLPSQPDSLGGIVEINPLFLTKEREWKMRITKFIIDNFNNSIFLVNDFGLMSLNLGSGVSKNLLTKSGKDNWYALALQTPNLLWVCNAKNYTVDGEVFCFNLKENSVVSSLKVSINPNNILFK